MDKLVAANLATGRDQAGKFAPGNSISRGGIGGKNIQIKERNLFKALKAVDMSNAAQLLRRAVQIGIGAEEGWTHAEQLQAMEFAAKYIYTRPDKIAQAGSANVVAFIFNGSSAPGSNGIALREVVDQPHESP